MIEIPDDVAKAIARWMREEVGPTPSGYHKDWPDLLDPKPPTLRERVAKEVGDIVRLAVPLVSHDAPEWDAEQADAVLAVVADWLAAQPHAATHGLAYVEQREHDVRLILAGGAS